MVTIDIKNCEAYEFLKTIPDKSINLIVTDPPYIFSRDNFKTTFGKKELIVTKKHFKGIDSKKQNFMYGFDIDTYFAEFKRIQAFLNAYVFCNQKLLYALMSYAENNDIAYEIMVWVKNNPLPAYKYHYMLDLEFIFYICEDKSLLLIDNYDDARKIFNTNIGTYKETEHPTEKPLSIVKTLIKNSSRVGECVLDCFSGSGTTAMACKELDRNFVGCELDKHFYDMSLKRLNGGVIKSLF